MTSIIKVDTVQDVDGNNIISENANTITIGASGDTISIPAGATLVNNGTATGFGISWQSSIVTAATLTAVANRGYWINTTSNACTITLPASATAGDTIIFVDYARKWGTNAVTINQNSLNFQGNTSPNPIYNTDGQSVTIVYSGATQGWIPTVDDDVTLETPQTYSIDFLVIAGGGSGGYNDGAGAGAGGYRTSTQSISPGTVITVTVGDGGAVKTSGGVGNNGSNSSISGSGLSTITSAGGGGGGATNLSGLSGGSGGGGSYTGEAGGAGNTPSTSPSQGNNGGSASTGAPYYGNSGGGGAGVVGSNATSSNGGNGGNGTASSITGSSVTRAGGGGGSQGGSVSVPALGVGGTGGGGNSGNSSQAATAGTVNTGSGGGGSGFGTNSGAGGKGVVILSLPTANYSSTTTGSPTVTTSGSNTILQFTGSGTYTG